jgi:hypothetical protein
MTSAERIAANRRNARASTGPRTAAGKRKAAANALRHGLAASVPDCAMTAMAARIATALAGEQSSPGRRALIAPIAEAQAEIWRARSARAALINLAAASISGHEEHREAEAIVQSLPQLTQLETYERRAMARRRRALRHLRKSELSTAK